MFICPRCDVTLDRTSAPAGVCWICPSCDGDAMGLSIVRSEVSEEFCRELWWAAQATEPDSGLSCPVCRREMPEVRLGVQSGDVESADVETGSGEDDAEHPHVDIDVCTTCQFVWFDTGERGRTPEKPPEPASEELPLEVRRHVARAEFELQRQLQRARRAAGGPPDDATQWFASSMLGLPIEHGAPHVEGRPWATWALTALVSLGTLSAFAFGPVENVVAAWGLVPAATFRHGGLTLVTSALLHANVMHFVANAYFLLIFGDNVEDFLGRGRYLLLFAAATLAGHALHVGTNLTSEVPIVGASAGIGGVLALYALRFPQARVGVWLPTQRERVYARIGARTAFGIWLAMQVVFVVLSKLGAGSIPGATPVGGAAAGLLFWLLWRPRPVE